MNILEDPAVREGSRRSILELAPRSRLYIGGQFAWRRDIVKDMFAQGELHKPSASRKVTPPKVTITAAAAKAFADAADAGVEVRCGSRSIRLQQLRPPRGPGAASDVAVTPAVVLHVAALAEQVQTDDHD